MHRRTFLLSATSLGIHPQLSEQTSPTVHSDQIGPWVEVDSKALTFNVSQLVKRTRRNLWAVLKNNAYGHGLVEVARCLSNETRVRGLAVFKVSSALKLRAAGIRKPILVMGPSSDSEFGEMIRQGITPTLYSDRQKLLERLIADRQSSIGVHLYVDTGMGRAGVPFDQASSLLNRLSDLRGLRYEGVMTALTEEDEFDLEQIRRLENVVKKAAALGVDLGERHAVSSAGIFHLSPSIMLDSVRPGIAIYGCYPTDRSESERPFELRPALSFKTRVMMVKQLQPGDSLQYHRIWKAPQRTWIATLAVGHHDGWPSATANRCEVMIADRRYPVVASVSSNHTLVDLGPSTNVQAGAEALLIGGSTRGSIEAHEVSKKIEGSVYQLLMHLNPDLPRLMV